VRDRLAGQIYLNLLKACFFLPYVGWQLRVPVVIGQCKPKWKEADDFNGFR
jgi:hypothetical protein